MEVRLNETGVELLKTKVELERWEQMQNGGKNYNSPSASVPYTEKYFKKSEVSATTFFCITNEV